MAKKAMGSMETGARTETTEMAVRMRAARLFRRTIRRPGWSRPGHKDRNQLSGLAKRPETESSRLLPASQANPVPGIVQSSSALSIKTDIYGSLTRLQAMVFDMPMP